MDFIFNAIVIYAMTGIVAQLVYAVVVEPSDMDDEQMFYAALTPFQHMLCAIFWPVKIFFSLYDRFG